MKGRKQIEFFIWGEWRERTQFSEKCCILVHVNINPSRIQTEDLKDSSLLMFTLHYKVRQIYWCKQFPNAINSISYRWHSVIKSISPRVWETLKETDNLSSVCIQTFLDDTYLFQRKEVLLSYLAIGSSFFGFCWDNQTCIKNFTYFWWF